MADFADTHVSLAGQGLLIGRIIGTPELGAITATVRVGGLDVVARTVAGLDVRNNDVVLVSRHGSARWVTTVIVPGDESPPTGSVVAVNGSTATVRLAGRNTDCQIVPDLTVNTDDVVLVIRRGTTRWVVDVVVPAAPPAGQEEEEESTPGGGDSSPDPKPKITTGTLTVKPVSTASFRDGGWRDDGDPVNSFDTYQGRFSGSAFGRMTGCAFYGSKPRTIAGATVTRVSIRLRRLSAGSFAKRRPTMWRVDQSTRPSGAPSLTGSAINGPNLAPGQTDNDFVLPDFWGQRLVDGEEGGLAIATGSDSPYIRLAGRNSWSAAWTLKINWRRES